MKVRLKSAVVGVAALTLAGAGLAATATSAFAAGPPWEPDPQAIGRVVFYDASGNVITGGSNLSQIAAYVASDTAGTGVKATLYFATPKIGTATGAWATAQASASTTFPNAAAPAPITGPGFTNPLVSLGATDGNLTNYIASFPNTDTTDPGYINAYQVRVKTNTSGSNYYEADITVNTTAGTWAEVDPTVTTTTTSISATPPSPQTTPASPVTLNSTVTPGENGTITFFDAGVQVGTPQAVTTGSPNASVSAGTPPTSPPDQTYTAKFIPTGGTQVQGSTSPVLTYHVGAPLVPTATALTVNPGSAAQFSSVTFTANITSPTDPSPPAGEAGSVQFFANGTTSIGTVSTNDGTVGEYKLVDASITLAPNAPNPPYNITAVFTPTSNLYSGSTSAQVPLTITAPTCPDGTTDCIDQQNVRVTVSAGSLTVTTPYTATNPFVLPSPVLNAAGTYLTTSGQFPAAGGPDIIVTSTQAGSPNWTLSVTDTDLTDAASDVINGQNLGLTGGVLDPSPGFPGGVTFTDNPPATPPVAAAAAGSLGLKGGPHTFAVSTGGGNGTANMHGTLTLNVPTSTPAGVYNGTITFSVT
jgi:hypothetical protein